MRAWFGVRAAACTAHRSRAIVPPEVPKGASVSDLPTGNAAIGQSGGPTAVINQSLAGVVEGLRHGLAASGRVKSIYGMRHGVRGIVKADGGLVDLTDSPPRSSRRSRRRPRQRSARPATSPTTPIASASSTAAASTTSATSSTSAATTAPTPAASSARRLQAPATSFAVSTCRRPSTTISWRTITRRASRPPRASSRWRIWATRSTMRASAASRSMW